MTFGSMTAMLQLYYKVTGTLNSFFDIDKSFIGGIAAERLMEIENLPHEQFHDEIKGETVTHPNIEFKNVAFEYSDKQQVLKDISFEIPAGETIGLVGPSGGRKNNDHQTHVITTSN